MKLEEIALADDFFVSRKLYPNVDFYTGVIYKAMGFPTRMFTVLFALGRLPGWIAQWREMIEDPATKIGRPRQVYVGATERDYVAGRRALAGRRAPNAGHSAAPGAVSARALLRSVTRADRSSDEGGRGVSVLGAAPKRAISWAFDAAVMVAGGLRRAAGGRRHALRRPLRRALAARAAHRAPRSSP